MIEIFGVTFYTLFWSRVIFVLLLMVSIFISIIIYIRTRDVKKTILYQFIAVLFIACIVFYDVFMIGNKVTGMCKKEGGLHIYKQEYAKGFVGGYIKSWNKYGFEYTEISIMGKKYRETIVDNKLVRKEVDDYVSDHSIVSKVEYFSNGKIKRIQDQMKNTLNDEILGELTVFTIFPGWVDSWIQGLVGFSFNPWQCGNEIENSRKKLFVSDLTLATLRAK